MKVEKFSEYGPLDMLFQTELRENPNLGVYLCATISLKYINHCETFLTPLDKGVIPPS